MLNDIVVAIGAVMTTGAAMAIIGIILSIVLDRKKG